MHKSSCKADSLSHPFPPSHFTTESQILILGSFPSLKSRELGFYYQHPKNRFWDVLFTIFGFSVDSKDCIEMQKTFLELHKIVLWDVVRSCSINGSSDMSMRHIVANDIHSLTKQMPSLAFIALNGVKATEIFCQSYGFVYDKKSTFPRILQRQDTSRALDTDAKILSLPSTSPANVSFSLQRLCQIWQILKT